MRVTRTDQETKALLCAHLSIETGASIRTVARWMDDAGSVSRVFHYALTAGMNALNLERQVTRLRPKPRKRAR